MNTYFNSVEREFILGSKVNAQENFILLWTRKEALLKAIGTGIITNLKQVTVSEEKNIINKESFDNQIIESVYDEHFIYSEKVHEYYLSIAIPQKAEINLHQINEENIISYLT
jgi:phosphopantetheinyl transferase